MSYDFGYITSDELQIVHTVVLGAAIFVSFGFAVNRTFDAVAANLTALLNERIRVYGTTLSLVIAQTDGITDSEPPYESKDLAELHRLDAQRIELRSRIQQFQRRRDGYRSNLGVWSWLGSVVCLYAAIGLLNALWMRHNLVARAVEGQSVIFYHDPTPLVGVLIALFVGLTLFLIANRAALSHIMSAMVLFVRYRQ